MCCILLLAQAACAGITATSQDLGSFSFSKGLTAGGSLTVGDTLYRGSDSIINRDPYQLNLNGFLNVNLWGIDMPFSFSYCNTNTTYTQPFNRFKLDPRYKWIHFLVGYNTMQLSRFTISDHDFCGVGMELTSGKWTVAGMYGCLAKAVECHELPS